MQLTFILPIFRIAYRKKWKMLFCKLSAELDVSIIFHCDKSDLEIDKEDALDTHKEYYNINPCQMCSINFDNEDRLKFITKIPTRTENSP